MAVYAYAPVFMRQALGEPRLSVPAAGLALASLATFLMAGRWGRWGDLTGRPARLVALGLAGAALALSLLPLVPSSAGFITLLVTTTAFLAAVMPLSVAWLTLRHPDRPGEAAAALYRARSVGWAAGSFGSGWLVDRAGMAGIELSFWLAAGMALAAAAVVSGLASRAPAVAPVTGGSGPASPPALAWGEAGPEGPGSSPVDLRRPSRPLRGAGTVTPSPLPAPLPSPAAPARPVWRYPAVVAIAVAVLFTAAGNEAFFAVFGPYLTEYLHGSSGQVGWALGIASTLGILIMAPVGRLADRWGPQRVFTLGILGYVVMYGLIAAFRTPLATVAAFALPLYPLTATGATGIISRTIPPERRGEGVGVYEGSAALAASVGGALGGLVADAAGLGSVPLVSLALALAGTAVAWRWVAGGTGGR
ncbi:arabinose efflux permease family protein [Thermaerobacter subterraneus DSM 13965]|uniref:Arabinose efflux permease family protein n=1 Tax=Thermaerobacter subterraneus DSM 13965 TaxID=867903 RepID=K6P2F3_9FIRM|nr:arabinose efflux permease family protein [Thermaerobacter subterraneus DSM 13965]